METSSYTQAEHIIAKFGGTTALSRALGHPYPTKVQGWKTRGRIPSQHHSPILAKAGEIGIELSPTDFFPELLEVDGGAAE